MVALQRATALGIDVNLIPKASENFSTPFTSSSRDIWINSLWLVSLALTLSVALVAGLVQQWLSYYVADISGQTPKRRACTRYYRYTGLNKWNVPAIIELLPVLMNTSLFLFFVGLILFTQDLSGMNVVRWFLVSITGVLLVVYVGMSFLPIWNAQCPYKTSLSRLYAASLWPIFILAKVRVEKERERERERKRERKRERERWLMKRPYVSGDAATFSRRMLKRLAGWIKTIILNLFTKPLNALSKKVAFHSVISLSSLTLSKGASHFGA